MSKVIHLIPYFGIGGVERAADSMRSVLTPDFSFEVIPVFDNLNSAQAGLYFHAKFFFKTLRYVLNEKPDVLIVSLWRCYLIGVACKLLCPRLKLVTFLHLPVHSHLVDLLATLLCGLLSNRIWSDCQSTHETRLPKLAQRKGRMISFITERFEPLPSKPVSPNFIFWGRLHRQKNVDRAITFFALVRDRLPEAALRFLIVGPDQGELKNLCSLCKRLGLEKSVDFLGERSFDEIRDLARSSSFFIQTSSHEGMGMSVVEAMQLGLVPVVTPVGEVSRYARNGLNAVVLTCDALGVSAVLQLLADNSSYQRVREEAISTWQSNRLYKDSVIDACRELIID